MRIDNPSIEVFYIAEVQVKFPYVDKLDIPLERDFFMRNLIRELSSLLEDMVGREEASGFISIVGQRIGSQLNKEYQQALNVEGIPRERISAVLIDLKRRIKGDFYLIEETEKKLVLGNRACPFAEKVRDRPSLCMMTSNVFGVIAAENVGYSKVILEQTIARGNPECRIVVYFDATDEAGKTTKGREYFQTEII